MIVTALTTGAAKGLGETAPRAIADGYNGLRQLLKRAFGSDPAAEVVLSGHETKPDTWRAPLSDKIAESGAANDLEVLDAARVLLERLDPDGAESGKYNVVLSNAQGTIIGDNSQQTNIFGNPLSGN